MTYLITRPVVTTDASGKPSGPQNMFVKYALRARDDYSKDKQPPNYLDNNGTPVPGKADTGAGAAQLTALFGGH